MSKKHTVRIKTTKFMPLADLVRMTTQTKVAKLLGCSQVNISRALSSNRAIYVSVRSDGTATAVELKGFMGSVDSAALHTIGESGIVGMSA